MMAVGYLVCHDSRYLRNVIRFAAYIGGLSAGMSSTMYLLHYPRWHGSDMSHVVASAAVLVALSLLGLAYERKVAYRAH